jgi:hypothetical protein
MKRESPAPSPVLVEMGTTTDALTRYFRGHWPHADRPVGDNEIRTIHAIAGTKGPVMILATTTVEDVDRFLEVFGTRGAEKRALHGSKGATVFADPSEANRVWALFDWDEAGWAAFVADPEVPPILKDAGHRGKPQSAPFLGSFGA